MVGLLTLTACTDQVQFRHDADVATCAWKEDCYGEDFNVCLEAAEGQTETHRVRLRRAAGPSVRSRAGADGVSGGGERAGLPGGVSAGLDLL